MDIDEETRFSSVHRGRVADDSGYEDDEDSLLDSRNTETFGDATTSLIEKSFSGMTVGVDSDGSRLSSRSSMVFMQRHFYSLAKTCIITCKIGLGFTWIL